MKTLSLEALLRALAMRDLTDLRQGPSAIQILIKEIESGLKELWPKSAAIRVMSSPLVRVSDCYDDLGYPADAVARTHGTRYVSEEWLLRTQMSAAIPP